MHFFFSILTLSTILAPVYAWRNVAEVNREMVVIPPDDAHIQFVGVEYKTATKKLREFYNYPNTADPTKWEGMHKLLEKNNTVEAGAKTNILRVPFNFNQLFIENSTTPVNETELNNLVSVVEAIVKSRPGPSPFVAIVPEVVNGTQRLRDADELYQFWRIIAKKFLHNNHVVFDLGLPATPDRAIAADMSQEAIRAIRRAGARKQYIFVPTDMATLSDPLRFGIQDPSHRTLYEVDIDVVCGMPYIPYRGPHRRIKKKKERAPALVRPLNKWMENTKRRTVVRRVQTNEDCPFEVDKLFKRMAKRPDRWAGFLWKENRQHRYDLEPKPN
uniref:cellulase n=1 Tax=Bionectria ochroleuca TaxID=29856 RepID=A0A8H7NEW1_BIOOC